MGLYVGGNPGLLLAAGHPTARCEPESFNTETNGVHLLGEPAPTAYDLKFQLLGIPVRVHPLFWLIGVIFGLNFPPPILVMWLAVLFGSILLHEMGHALTMRHFGLGSRVVLHSMGGLAIPDGSVSGFGRQRIGPREQNLISIAGPVAQLILAAIVVLIVTLLGGRVVFGLPEDIAREGLNFWDIRLAVGGKLLQPRDYGMAYELVDKLLYVNIFWAVLNLLPVYPLDGGQIAREVMMQQDPGQGLQKSLWLSVYTGALIAICAVFLFERLFMGVMFGMLAYSSYEALQRTGYR
jgi:stage IV sporulation protein FB